MWKQDKTRQVLGRDIRIKGARFSLTAELIDNGSEFWRAGHITPCFTVAGMAGFGTLLSVGSKRRRVIYLTLYSSGTR